MVADISGELKSSADKDTLDCVLKQKKPILHKQDRLFYFE